MKLIGSEGRWGIAPGWDEVFFIHQDPQPGIQTRPRIIPPLAQWLDETVPRQWGTGRIDRTQCIRIDDHRLFQLFKLAWQGREEIMLNGDGETFIYCPYIPLIITSAIPDVPHSED